MFQEVYYTIEADDTSAPERVEVEDVEGACALVTYFKAHMRRVHARLYGEDRDERLIEDLSRFLVDKGGVFKGTATELHLQLRSAFKPKRPDDLTKKIQKYAGTHDSLECELGTEWDSERKNTFRFVRVALKIGVMGVMGVMDREGEETVEEVF